LRRRWNGRRVWVVVRSLMAMALDPFG